MSDTGSNCDNKPQQEDVNLEEAQSEAVTVPEIENKLDTPVKKRLSAVERAQRESEALVKTLGGSLDIEGGRKTRSSTRGTPSRSNVVHTPPPSKKARGTGTPKRGRGRKLETAMEDEIKISPEKAPSEPESNHEEIDSSTLDTAKTEEKPEDNKSEVTETPSALTEENASSAKQDDKPEPMEVDGVSKATAKETKLADESTQNEADLLAKPIEDEAEKTDKVSAEPIESSSSAPKEAADPPVASTDDDNKIADDAHVNNVIANDIKVNSNSLPVEASLPNPPATPAVPATTAESATPATPDTPATPVSVAENEHKTESNDLCEPKIASPPITANNEGATPQYCN